MTKRIRTAILRATIRCPNHWTIATVVGYLFFFLSLPVILSNQLGATATSGSPKRTRTSSLLCQKQKCYHYTIGECFIFLDQYPRPFNSIPYALHLFLIAVSLTLYFFAISVRGIFSTSFFSSSNDT